MREFEFVECTPCAAKPGSSLCAACLQNRATINALRRGLEREALLELYTVAAQLRTFPVPFDTHFELVGAVDKCRSILEPPVNTYASSDRAETLL